jgi:hypothetical protein
MLNTWRSAAAVAATGIMLWGGAALAQPKTDCPKREMVEGQIVSIDQEHGTLTVQSPEGKRFEFRASRETLADKKVGDKIELTRRAPEGCK